MAAASPSSPPRPRRAATLLFTAGAEIKTAADWSTYAPRLIDRGDGSPVVDTAFTRLTGKSPILLAGMTPTTVDPEIVAAAANAGHWAELAGGGQVTEQIFADNVAKLTELLDEGRTAQFNTLFLDPYLWRMQVGGQRLLQKARLAGAPFDGLVLSAGIPDLEDAVDDHRGPPRRRHHATSCSSPARSSRSARCWPSPVRSTPR